MIFENVQSCHNPDSPESAPHIHDRAYFRKWHGPWYGFEHADLNIGHITDRHKLVAYSNPAYGELYDMREDPDQIVNLWAKPDYAELRFRLMQGLLTEEMNRNHPCVARYPEDFGRPLPGEIRSPG